MTRYRLDQEIVDVLAVSAAELAGPPALPPGDWRALRSAIAKEYAALADVAPPVPADVTMENLTIVTDDGWSMRARWYARGDDRPGPAVVYAHGGGMVAGSLDDYEQIVATYVSGTGVPFLSVDYRLAPEAKGARPAQDVLDAVRWLVAHASERGVEPDRFALMGDSGGGGVAASTAILARERGVAIAALLLIFPMLDDRVDAASPALEPFLTWTAEMNATGWAARVDGPVTPATSPARLEDHRGLPPTYLEVGDLDLFRDECIAFAARLARADVPLELHVHPSVPHGYDMTAPAAGVSRRAMADRLRVLVGL
jgi:acetyl esterase/lipase